MGIGVVVPNLAFCKGVANGSDLRFRQPFEDISPEGLDRYFDLGDRKHHLPDRRSFGVGDVYLEILNIRGVIELRMNPVGVPDRIDVLRKLRVLEGFQMEATLENIPLPLQGVFLAIQDVCLRGRLESRLQQHLFDQILDLLNRQLR
jgi:hypothetical protein